MVRFVIVLFSLFVVITCYGKKHNCDTIEICDKICIIEIPHPATYNIQHYEEGSFCNLFSLIDSVGIVIHCGYLVNLPLVKTDRLNILKRKDRNNELITIGYKVLGREKKYYIEKYNKKSMISFLFENISKHKLRKYKKISNKIFIRGKNKEIRGAKIVGH